MALTAVLSVWVLSQNACQQSTGWSSNKSVDQSIEFTFRTVQMTVTVPGKAPHELRIQLFLGDCSWGCWWACSGGNMLRRTSVCHDKTHLALAVQSPNCFWWLTPALYLQHQNVWNENNCEQIFEWSEESFRLAQSGYNRNCPRAVHCFWMHPAGSYSSLEPRKKKEKKRKV